MYSGNPYQLQQALEELARHDRNRDQSAARAALRLYHRTRRRGWLGRLWSVMTGRDEHLIDLRLVVARHQIGNRCDEGCRMVALRQIHGSEGRCRDFDANFRPLQPHCATRWLGVAMAWKTGTALPPVSLIRVGDVYFVRDGHHRVSVARALGQAEIEAEVTVWREAGGLAPLSHHPMGDQGTAWLAPRFRPVLHRLNLLMVALGGRLVARGLPPFHSNPEEPTGAQPGKLLV
jgi:hypothetical protein